MIYKKYKVLREFVLPTGSHQNPGDRINFADEAYNQNKLFIDSLVQHGFLKRIKEKNFGVIATSKLAGVEIADKDYTDGDKKYFTYDEALEVEKGLKDGWRLPTRHEWALICEEFANDKNDRLSVKLLMEKLGLCLNGYRDNDGNICGEDRDGNYWSRSSYSSTGNAYYLGFDTGVYPSNYYYRYGGFSLRCVRDLHREGGNE